MSCDATHPRKTCPHCGRVNDGHYKFCLDCGQELDDRESTRIPAPEGAPNAVRRCRECGRENASHYKFCLGCGQELVNGPTQPMATEQRGALLHERFFAAQPAATTRSPAGLTALCLGAALLVALVAFLVWLVL